VAVPTNQALQVFYGTIPLILVLLGIWLREQMLLKDILERLRNIETRFSAMHEPCVDALVQARFRPDDLAF
jgi:hypothetical protein